MLTPDQRSPERAFLDRLHSALHCSDCPAWVSTHLSRRHQPSPLRMEQRLNGPRRGFGGERVRIFDRIHRTLVFRETPAWLGGCFCLIWRRFNPPWREKNAVRHDNGDHIFRKRNSHNVMRCGFEKHFARKSVPLERFCFDLERAAVAGNDEEGFHGCNRSRRHLIFKLLSLAWEAAARWAGGKPRLPCFHITR